jgi:hypothetical protein
LTLDCRDAARLLTGTNSAQWEVVVVVVVVTVVVWWWTGGVVHGG